MKQIGISRIWFFVIVIGVYGCSASMHRIRTGSESNRYGNLHPEIGTVTLRTLPSKIEGDTLKVLPSYLVFGADPSITIKRYDFSKYPNPFSPSPHIRMVNLVPDTLVVTILEDDEVPKATLYREYIERGIVEVRIDLNDRLTEGGYYFVEVSVGEEIKKKRTLCN